MLTRQSCLSEKTVLLTEGCPSSNGGIASQRAAPDPRLSTIVVTGISVLSPVATLGLKQNACCPTLGWLSTIVFFMA